MSGSIDAGRPSSFATRMEKRAMRSERPRVCGSAASITCVSARTVASSGWIGSWIGSWIESMGRALPRRGPPRGRPCGRPGSTDPRLPPGSRHPGARAPVPIGRTPGRRRFGVKQGLRADDTPIEMPPETPYEFAPEELNFLQGEEALAPTVLAWRPAEDWGDVRGLVARTEPRVAELMLMLVRAEAAWRPQW